jgi:peptide/nickel transport system permease protein
VIGVVGRRLVALVPTLLLISFGVFALVTLVPGDAAATIAGGASADPARVAEIRHELGLDDPLLVQYEHWLEGAVHLDFGDSLIGRTPVSADLSRRCPITASIALGALAVALLIGIPVGLLAGVRPRSRLDRVLLVGTSVGVAVPSFLVATVLITFVAVELHWLDPIGYTPFGSSPWQWFRHLILPCVSLGIGGAAGIARQLRAALIGEMRKQYVRTAWAMGATPVRVVLKHALKNASLPVVTTLGLELASLLGGAVIIEYLFAIEGLGSYMIRAIPAFDVPVIQGVTIVIVLAYVVVTLLVDLAYTLLDPRVRIR